MANVMNYVKLFIVLTLTTLFLVWITAVWTQRIDPQKHLVADKKITTFRVNCQQQLCFDYAKCSVRSGFPVYLYPLADSVTDKRLLMWKDAISSSPYATETPDTACIFIYLSVDSFESEKLSHWKVQGQNHVIINVMSSDVIVDQSQAMVAQTEFHNYEPVQGFDIRLPYMELLPIAEEKLPMLLPARRSNLLSFRGAAPATQSMNTEYITTLSQLQDTEQAISISTSCETDLSCGSDLWCLCKDSKIEYLQQSTFVIIPNDEYMPYSQLASRLHSAMSNGAIPVIIGSHYPLPMDELIPWAEATIKLPTQRVNELVYIINNFVESDIIHLKKHGRSLMENHLISVAKIAGTLLDILRTRLYVPPHQAPSPKSSLMYSKRNPMPMADNTNALRGKLAPADVYSSPSYLLQFTSWQSGAGGLSWNKFSYLYPSTPWDPMLPVDAQSHGQEAHGDESHPRRSLERNHPREQFTIVIQTYNRPDALLKQLAQLNGLPLLNKVLVVWNTASYPSSTFKWPRLHVKIEVIKSAKNSLNNRFLPYKEIETDGVLSLDDDLFLKHEQILFAFRAWQEHRDQLVGYPGRTWARNVKTSHWEYQRGADCQLSMVLTSAAFFHKYYMYQYSYFMPQAIRDRIDELTNCEDIAMNFLISHISGKPPVKVSKPILYNCQECSNNSLSKDPYHYIEREDCVRYFIKVYGYLPLRYTQLRIDSIYFDMKPPKGEKCFLHV